MLLSLRPSHRSTTSVKPQQWLPVAIAQLECAGADRESGISGEAALTETIISLFNRRNLIKQSGRCRRTLAPI
ncbi:MAG TPA: hypothetical protein V6D19_24425 [Stenomitos sp.]